MKPLANQPTTVRVSLEGKLTKKGSTRRVRAAASQPATMSVKSTARPTRSRSRSDARRAGIALLDLVPQVVPDPLVEARELVAEPDLDHVARARDRDRISGLDPPRPRGEHDDLVGERDGRLEVVGDEEHGVARFRP